MIIASALETHPWVIWPSRYHDPITHEFIDRTRMIRQKKRERASGLTRFLTGTATPGHLWQGLPERLLALHTLDVGTQRAQFVFNTLVTTIDVVDTIHNRRSFRDTTR